MARASKSRAGKGRLSRVGDLSWAAIEMAGGWAETSKRLSDDERDELKRLRKKARNKRTPLSKAERAKYTSLVVKAVGVERLRDQLGRKDSPDDAPRETRDVDPADRLRRAAELRDQGVITEDDFERLKARYIEQL